ncbi:hypothetical protein H8891_07210 [Paeniclostridium sp. NSJ-45]|uniref:Uncharacterized protein n=1 Tax=Paeniclostridium hominis TaxID=2764329 RepID=A0ABR7K3M0_9FIRM|nr:MULTISPECIES: hypothetical protein [Paeniclostridium]MBC6003587.1 hypothetical protein [Paeniclostridium hominis]
MERYNQTLNRMSVKLNENYLFIGNILAQGCYKNHIGYEFSIFSLKNSENNNNEIFSRFDISKQEFWDTIRKLNSSDLDLYFKALYEFSNYMGSSWD